MRVLVDSREQLGSENGAEPVDECGCAEKGHGSAATSTGATIPADLKPAEMESAPETGLPETWYTLAAELPEKRKPSIGRRRSLLAHWLKSRGALYVAIRLTCLLRRYGFTSRRTKRRVRDCMELLARYECCPTFPIPARVMRRDPRFCHELQAKGAELAVHGYDHYDFRCLSKSDAESQLIAATRVFRDCGIEYAGFRCPYLSGTDALLDALPEGLFEYSSNRAVWWDVIPKQSSGGSSVIFDRLLGFYRPELAENTVSAPFSRGNLLEVPVCCPDDIQLRDGLGLGQQGIASVWKEILRQTHQRGELFTLVFHPELFDECNQALESALEHSKSLQPAVWVTQLRDVSRWWQEKSSFGTSTTVSATAVSVQFNCSDRATVLVRNLETREPTQHWCGSYSVLKGRTLSAAVGVIPFVGVRDDVPRTTVQFLKDQGYLIEEGEQAANCGLVLDKSSVDRLGSPVTIIEHIESSEAPLVRFSRWPEGARSALCITGDLDALSLADYASRVFM